MNLRKWGYKLLLIILFVLFATTAMAGQVLYKGDPAPEDGRFFTVEEARELLLVVEEARSLKVELVLAEKQIEMMNRQIDLIQEQNQLLEAHNDRLMKQLARWESVDTMKRVVSIGTSIGLFALGIFAGGGF